MLYAPYIADRAPNCDPCDEWPWDRGNGTFMADRRQPITVEGFTPRDLPRDIAPRFASMLPFVRTDWSHWSNELDWTLESGPDEAPSSIEIGIPYSYSGGSGDYFAGGCWNPGDPIEVEIGTAYFIHDGVRCEVNLTAAEADRVELYIAENPPEPDYGEDY